MDKPEFVYKFTGHSGFLENGLFRFSPPAALNDPLEALPEVVYDRYAPEDWDAARKRASEAGLHGLTEENLERLFLAPYPAGRMDENSFPGLWPMKETRLRDEPFATLAEFDIALGHRAVELARRYADDHLGILSLASGVNEPLWSHYGAGHKGLCVKFQTSHAAFEKLRPIEYSDVSVAVSSNGGMVRLGGVRWRVETILAGTVDSVPDVLLFRKRLEWAHEKEWRLVANLVDADERRDAPAGEAHDISLFRLPFAAIQAVTLGYKSTDAVADEVVEKVRRNPDWAGAPINRRVKTPRGIEEIQLFP